MDLISRIPKNVRWILIIMSIFLLMMMIYRLGFFYYYRPEGRPLPGSAFLLGLRFDLRAVFILGLSMFLITSFGFLNPFKSRRAYKGWPVVLSFIFLVFLVFYASDFYHYDYLKARLNASVLNYAEDAAISFTMMWESYPLIRVAILFFLLLLFWFLLMKMILKKISAGQYIHEKRWRAGYNTAFFIIAAIFIFGRIGQFPLRWSDAYRFGDEFKASVSLNPFQTFSSTLKFKNSTYDPGKVKAAYPVVSSYLGVQEPDAGTLNFDRKFIYSDSFKVKPNVILVLCESFSSYKSSMHGNKLNASPYFAQLASQGSYFDWCFTPATGTARGIWATVTGIPDVERPKTASRNPMAVDQHTIISDFKSHEKFYFLGGSASWANIRGLLTNNIPGIKIYEEGDYKAPQEDVWGISDKNLFLESNAVLAAAVKPFFAIIQTANNHRPYTIPDEDLPYFTKLSFPEDTLKKYGFENNEELNAFRYMDYSIQKFMEAAEKESYYKNTIFVFIGDHGIRGDAKAMFSHNYTRFGLMAEHVPLLFYGPGIVPASRIGDVSSQLDVLPSIAHLARQSHTNTTLGRNLFDSSQNGKFAFIADPDLNSIGLLNKDYYFFKDKNGSKEFVSITNDLPVPVNAYTDSLKLQMERLAEGLFTTAGYLLFTNKKRN